MTGLSSRFTAEAPRASHLGNVAVLVAAGLTATAVRGGGQRAEALQRSPTASPVTEPPMPNGVRTEASGWPALT